MEMKNVGRREQEEKKQERERPPRMGEREQPKSCRLAQKPPIFPRSSSVNRMLKSEKIPSSRRSSAPLEQSDDGQVSERSEGSLAKEPSLRLSTKRLSSLDLMRMKIDAQIAECPSDERKTREYLHRQKVACGLVMSRRIIGNPEDTEDKSSRASDSQSTSNASSPAPNARKERDELPKLSASAPPSPHHRKDSSPRRPEEVRKSRPIWEPAHSLSLDKNALTARARLETPVKVEFKIPNDVTWSTNMSTKSRVWCDFLLDRPKRVWNWGKKLEKIHDDVEAGTRDIEREQDRSSIVQVTKIKGDLVSEAIVPLQQVAESLCTRQDIAAAHHATKISLRAERALRRLFTLSAQSGTSTSDMDSPVDSALKQLKKGLLGVEGPEDTETDVRQLRDPEGILDARSFSLLLQRLDLISESVTKHTALNILADVKGEPHGAPVKEIKFSHFRSALKNIARLNGKGMVEVMCLHKEAPSPFERMQLPQQEALVENRDRHVENEKKILESMVSNLLAIADAQAETSRSASTYDLRIAGRAFETEVQRKPGAKTAGHQRADLKSEMPLLLDLRENLDDLRDTLKVAAVKDAEVLASRTIMGRDLKSRLQQAQDAFAEKNFDMLDDSGLVAGGTSPLSSIGTATRRRGHHDRRQKAGKELMEALEPPNQLYNLDFEDTREAIDTALHRLRLTKGRRKAPIEDLDRGDLYFTSSSSDADTDDEEHREHAQRELRLKEKDTDTDRERLESLPQSESERKALIRNKVLTQVELLRADNLDANADAVALELIQNVSKECGVECDVAFVSQLMRASQSPWEKMKHILIDTIKGGKQVHGMMALIKALQHTAEQDTVMALLRHFLRELRKVEALPSRNPAWPFYLSGQVDLQVPTNLFVQQRVAFRYRYRNEAAEKAAAAPPGSHDPKSCTYHPLLGWHGRDPADLNRKGLIASDKVKPPRLPSPEPAAKSAGSPPPRKAPPTPPAPGAKEGTEAAPEPRLNGEEERGNGDEKQGYMPGTPQPSETHMLVQELKQEVQDLRQVQARRRQEAAMRDQWEVSRMKGGLDTEMLKRLEPARDLVQHAAGDWVGVCRQKASSPGHMESFSSFALTEDLDDELKAICQKAAHLEAQDVFVEVQIVPPENEGALIFEKGISIPGTYVLKYFTEGSPLPLAVSERFVVDFPRVRIEAPTDLEIGLPLHLTLMVSNFDFAAVRVTGAAVPHMSSADSIAIFAQADKGKCVFSERVPTWTQATDIRITAFNPPSPGQYVIEYRLGEYGDSVAGRFEINIKFPSKSANRFSNVELETLSMQQHREARVYVSLSAQDMESEAETLMKHVAASVQAEMEDKSVTCTFVCLNFHQDKEETTFERGVCAAIRSILAEIDRCRPFFVSLLGERYGLVPTLQQREKKDVQKMYDEYPWMLNFKNPFVNTALGYSMLEIEVLYAVLMAEPEEALVYERDIAFVSKLPADKRKMYNEVGCGEMSTIAARSAMSDLKMRLRGVPKLKKTVYRHPKEIADLAAGDLLKALHRKFPSTPTELERNCILVESTCRSHFMLMDTKVWTDVHTQIQEHIETEGVNMVVVTGAGCSGKTAICAQWMKKHFLKYVDRKDGEKLHLISSAMSDGPRADLAPHMLINTFVSHLADPSIESILRHLYLQIRRLSTCQRVLPMEGQCLQEFSTWMADAAKYGLIWVIDNLHLVVGVEDLRFLFQSAPKGVVVLATCDTSRADIIALLTSPTSRIVSIPSLDAEHTWSLQQHYCEAYQYAPDDELVWKIVEKGSNYTVSHVRTILMAHRLMREENASWTNSDVTDIMECADAETAFVKLMLVLQQWEPMLAQVLMMTAWSHRGLREMELLSLIDTLSQVQLRRYKEILLDELFMPMFGVYEFINASLKWALRRSMSEKETRKEWKLASPSLHAMLAFFGNTSNVSDFRRSVECPTLFSSDSSNEKLFNYITTCQCASLMVASKQTHLVEKYMQKIDLSMNQFVGFILSDMQQQFGESVQKNHAYQTVYTSSNPTELIKIFQQFSVSKTPDSAHYASKFSFTKQNDCWHTMSCNEWLRALEFLELIKIPTKECISEGEAIKIFDYVSGMDLQAEISYIEFRYALMTVCEKLTLPSSYVIQSCSEVTQLHRFFDFFAENIPSKRSKALGGNAGNRAEKDSKSERDIMAVVPRTLDKDQYSKMLDSLGFSAIHQKFKLNEILDLLKSAKEACRREGLNTTQTDRQMQTVKESEVIAGGVWVGLDEMDYLELIWCLRAMAAQLKVDLHSLVGQTFASVLKERDKEREKEMLNTTESGSLHGGSQYHLPFDAISGMSSEKQQDFMLQCARISMLFCELKSYEGAIDVMEVLLRACYAGLQFHDIGNANVLPVYGSQEMIAEILSTYSRCAHSEASSLVNLRKDMQVRSDHLADAVSEAGAKEQTRRKSLSGQRLTVAVRREDEELHTTYIKKVEKMHKEQADLEAAMFDNTNQLRWIRRRASTAASAARNLIDVLQAHVKATSTAEMPPGPNTSAPNKFSFSVTDPDENTVACLKSCLKVLDEDPESDWGSLRSTIKQLTNNPLDCHTIANINMTIGWETPADIALKQVRSIFGPSS